MAIDFEHARQLPEDADLDAVAVPVYEGEADAADEPDAAGVGSGFAATQGFEGKAGQACPVPGENGALRVAVGLGRREDATVDTFRRAGAAFVRAAWRAERVGVRLLEDPPEGLDLRALAQAVAEGMSLAAYRFTAYKSDPDACRITSAVVAATGGRKIADGLERGSVVAGAVVMARDLVNEPPGSLTPAALAKAAERLAGENLEVEVLDEKAMRKEGLGGILGVGQGSSNPPRLVKLTYTPATPRGTVALVGKGITFDSGGLSIKTGEGMMTMKTDMSGAAAVLASMSAIARLGARTRVVGYLCSAENMPSGSAIRPGDVLRIRNGKTVEVLNTDAEGRLVLADGLSLASEEEPAAIIDVATLTGACMVALGNKVAGLMGTSDDLMEQVEAAAERAGEPVWRLPLPDDYRKQLESEVADVKNIGAGRYGGALTAGLFLKEFVDGAPWAHLDIAGPARSEEDDGYLAKGGTGFAVRTLIETVTGFRKPRN